MAQIVYYFYAALALGAPDRKVSFSVPTGNFGDIFAGYLAKRMGLPIDQLIIATNSNDILHRCISANDHSKNRSFTHCHPVWILWCQVTLSVCCLSYMAVMALRYKTHGRF